MTERAPEQSIDPTKFYVVDGVALLMLLSLAEITPSTFTADAIRGFVAKAEEFDP